MSMEAVENIIINTEHKNIILFGAGLLFEEFVKQTTIKLPSQIYDNDKSKWGKKIHHNRYEIVSPEGLKDISDKEDTLVLITSGKAEEIASQVEAYGFFSWMSLQYLIYRNTIEDYINHIDIKSCMIETSNFCNARCTFCVNPTMERKKMNMSDEIFEKTLFRLKELKQYPEMFRLHCLGEPLLDPHLFDKIKKLKEEFPKSSVGYASNFGIASQEYIDKIFESGQDFIVISLNTNSREEYQKTMKLDYDKTIENVRVLLNEKSKRNSKLKITMSIVENEYNELEVRAFAEKWEREGVDVRKLQQGKWVEKKPIKIDDKKNTEYKNHTINNYVCQQLYQEICVLSNGDYALCCFDGESCLDLGNVKNTSIYEMFHNVKKNEIIRAMMHGESSLDLCNGCSFLK